MSYSLAAGLVVLVAAVVLARWVGERAQKALSDEQKLRIAERFSTFRKVQLLPMLALLLGYLVLHKLQPVPGPVLTWAVMSGLVAYLLLLNAYALRRLRQMDLPPRYLRDFLAGRAIQLVGVIAFLCILLTDPSGR